jgi:hypothetical protein
MSKKSDAQELNEILRNATPPSDDGSDSIPYKGIRGFPLGTQAESPVVEHMPQSGGYVQWTTSDGNRFIPASKTAKKLTPGVYDIQHSQTVGIYFEKIPVLTTGLLEFPETNSIKVVDEIKKFWKKEDVFKEYNLTYKRGIILWGPPGSGKSCTIQLIMRDVVAQGGIVIKFGHPSIFSEGVRKFREIQPDTPVVILMEDIDSIIETYNESDVLNILDGVSQIDKAVFLATTNYPEKLGARIINRPSRFDKRFKIDHPNAESRRIYLEYIMGGPVKVKDLKIDLDRWVEDTEDFSLAHLKELFTAVIILGDEYNDALEALSSMREIKPTSSDDEYKNPMGFAITEKSMRKNVR